MARRAAGDAFWRFSLAIYRRPSIAAACLALQDRCGLDVNLLLFCLWQARLGRRLSPADLRRAMRRAAPIQMGIIAPLRAARRALKRQSGLAEPALSRTAARLRRALLRHELAAEHFEQTALAGLTIGKPAPATGGLAAINLGAYRIAAGVSARSASAAGLARFANVFVESPVVSSTRKTYRFSLRRRRRKARK